LQQSFFVNKDWINFNIECSTRDIFLYEISPYHKRGSKGKIFSDGKNIGKAFES